MYNDAKAQRAVRFIEGLKLFEGEWAGQYLKLELWQKKRIVMPVFGTVNRDGTRTIRTVYIEIPRKNGKTTLAAPIALLLLCADDEPGAQIYSAAADREQASLVFNVAEQMVLQNPTLSKLCKIIPSRKRIVYKPTQSFYSAISSEAYTKHGMNAHGIIFDELHAQPNRELWDVLRTSKGSRRQPLTVAITTSGYDRNSICWEQHDYARKVERKIIKDKTYLPVIYSAADKKDNFDKVKWTDEKVWKKANPALGHHRKIEEMREACNTAKESPAYENTFKRLYLNIWTKQESRWIPMQKWDRNARYCEIESLRGQKCWGGLDLASTTDIAAFAKVFPPAFEGDRYKCLLTFWIPEESMRERSRRDKVDYDLWVRQGHIRATRGNVIDYGEILRDIKQDAEDYDLQQVAFDRWGATKLQQSLTDAGIEMVSFGQGFASMSSPSKELLTIILSTNMEHFGNPVLRWMADNVVAEQDAAGNVKPSKKKSTEKIDGIVALIMGIDLAVRQENNKPEKSVYEDRGVIAL